jgi:hypothetical protein
MPNDPRSRFLPLLAQGADELFQTMEQASATVQAPLANVMSKLPQGVQDFMASQDPGLGFGHGAPTLAHVGPQLAHAAPVAALALGAGKIPKVAKMMSYTPASKIFRGVSSFKTRESTGNIIPAHGIRDFLDKAPREDTRFVYHPETGGMIIGRALDVTHDELRKGAHLSPQESVVEGFLSPEGQVEIYGMPEQFNHATSQYEYHNNKHLQQFINLVNYTRRIDGSGTSFKGASRLADSQIQEALTNIHKNPTPHVMQLDGHPSAKLSNYNPTGLVTVFPKGTWEDLFKTISSEEGGKFIYNQHTGQLVHASVEQATVGELHHPQLGVAFGFPADTPYSTTGHESLVLGHTGKPYPSIRSNNEASIKKFADHIEPHIGAEYPIRANVWGQTRSNDPMAWVTQLGHITNPNALEESRLKQQDEWLMKDDKPPSSPQFLNLEGIDP